MNIKTILITGTSRGLGYGLAKVFLDEYHIIGLSRSNCDLVQNQNYEHIQYDLKDLSRIYPVLENFFTSKKNQIQIHLLILNSGILGNIAQDLYKTSIESFQEVFQINVWSNKVLIDTLIELEEKGIIKGPERILGISSGVSQSLNRGWNAYALSKASLNNMLKLYSEEFPEKKFISMAPGLIQTYMQDTIYSKGIDLEKYPSFKRLIDSRGTENMQDPVIAAEKIKNNIDKIFSLPSGSYVDIRKI